MIAKIGKGSNMYGAIWYNQQKVETENGAVLLLNKIPDTMNGRYSVAYFNQCFEPYLSANIKTEKMARHISLNPDPKDTVSDEQFTEKAQEYMERMGYGNQPYIVFKHTDNRNDKSTSISTQLDSLIPASKIPTLTQGMFVGSVSDNFDERIEQKIFHAEIVVDNDKVAAETKAYKKIPQILSFVDENGADNMKQEIENNYMQIKAEVIHIVECKMERIKTPHIYSIWHRRIND